MWRLVHLIQCCSSSNPAGNLTQVQIDDSAYIPCVGNAICLLTLFWRTRAIPSAMHSTHLK